MTFLLSLALAAMIAPTPPPGSAPKLPEAAPAPRAAVEAATAAFHQALRTNDPGALFTYVADDVVMMPPGEAPVRGKEAMRAWYAGFLSQYRTSSLILTGREVLVGDGWAVETGAFEWELRPADGGDPTVDRGHYMQVWKAQADGRWRFAREIWNGSGPEGGRP